MFNKLHTLIISALLLLVNPAITFGDDSSSTPSLEDNLPIVRYEKKASRISLPDLSEHEGFSLDSIPAAERAKADASIMNFMKHDFPERMAKMIEIKPLPRCQSSRVRREQVFQETENSQSIDFVFYSPLDPAQNRKAENFGERAVPYKPGSEVGINSSNHDPRPAFAMMTGVECLPTRVHFVNLPEGRFLEFKEGDLAFEQ